LTKCSLWKPRGIRLLLIQLIENLPQRDAETDMPRCRWEKAGKRQLAITSETPFATRYTNHHTTHFATHYTTAPLHTHTHRTKCTSNKTSPTWKRAICRNCVSLICVLPANPPFPFPIPSAHNTACRRSVKLLCKMFHGCKARNRTVYLGIAAKKYLTKFKVCSISKPFKG